MDLIEFTERYFGVEFTEYQKDYIRKLDEKGRNNMTETKTHLIADETIGGVQREYIDVGHKAEVGDYVHITYFERENVSEIQKVTEYSSVFPKDFYFTPGIRDEYGDMENYFNGDREEYRTLEPTDIVHIDGSRYQIVERKAEVGEKVLIVNTLFDYGTVDVGSVFTVSGISEDCAFKNEENLRGIKVSETRVVFLEAEYRVLTPAEPTPDIHDLLANLAQRVTSLERITGELVRAKSSLESQLRDTQNNVQTFAEQTEANTKDIAFLDERTEQPKKPTKSAEEILREISKILERDERQ